MIEFELKRARNGKRSRWAKKFPRKRVFHRGDEKAAYWFKTNWLDDNYRYLKSDFLDKFLMSNIGRPVDKVFSEFLDRCDESAKIYNLRKRFYEMFQEKSEIGWSGGFYITNGILNYKKRTKKPEHHNYVSIGDYNRAIMSDVVISTLCRQCELSHLKQPMGEFKLAYNIQKRVYLVERDVWLSDLKLQVHYRLCSIYGVGNGVSKIWYCHRAKYNIWDSWDRSKLPEFVFITKN